MMMTLAPFVTMEVIWFCCSATVLLAGAYWTFGLNPALVRSSVNSWPARTQFCEVLSGSATPIVELAGKPAAGVAPLLAPPPEPPRLEQPASAIAAIVAIAAEARMTFFMSTSLGGTEKNRRQPRGLRSLGRTVASGPPDGVGVCEPSGPTCTGRPSSGPDRRPRPSRPRIDGLPCRLL